MLTIDEAMQRFNQSRQIAAWIRTGPHAGFHVARERVPVSISTWLGETLGVSQRELEALGNNYVRYSYVDMSIQIINGDPQMTTSKLFIYGNFHTLMPDEGRARFKQLYMPHRHVRALERGWGMLDPDAQVNYNVKMGIPGQVWPGRFYRGEIGALDDGDF